MKIKTVVISGALERGEGENDFVDLHCQFKFDNGEVIEETIKNFPYSPSKKNVCYDLLEDEIFEKLEKLNLNDEEKRFLSIASRDALERFVYKVWRTEGSI